MIAGRECDADSTHPADFVPEQYEVCFTPLKTCPDGFLVDHGAVYGP